MKSQINSFFSISSVSVDQVEDPEMNFDFSGLRLDWCRLQSYVSNAQVGKPGLLLDAFKATGIAALLNTIVFHTVIDFCHRNVFTRFFIINTL